MPLNLSLERLFTLSLDPKHVLARVERGSQLKRGPSARQPTLFFVAVAEVPQRAARGIESLALRECGTSGFEFSFLHQPPPLEKQVLRQGAVLR